MWTESFYQHALMKSRISVPKLPNAPQQRRPSPARLRSPSRSLKSTQISPESLGPKARKSKSKAFLRAPFPPQSDCYEDDDDDDGECDGIGTVPLLRL